MNNFKDQKNIIKEKITDFLVKNNLTLFDINYLKEFNTNVLQILVEDQKTIIDLDRLTVISEEINTIIDQLDLFSEEYLLEVSTPGVERPLRTFLEVKEQVGKYVYFEFNEKVNDQLEVIGTLLQVGNEENIVVEYFQKGVPKKLTTNYQNIKTARCAVKF